MNGRELYELTPKCTATRRDGAPCRCVATRATVAKGRALCPRHGGGWRSGTTPARASKDAARARARKVKAAPAEIRALPEWRELEAGRDVKRLAWMVDAWESYQQTADALAFQTARRELVQGHRAARQREAATMARRYAEREALGIPHPADPAKW